MDRKFEASTRSTSNRGIGRSGSALDFHSPGYNYAVSPDVTVMLLAKPF